MKEFKKYLKQLKKGIFFEAFNLIKKKPKLYFLMLLMDICLLLGGYVVGKAGNLAMSPLLSLKNVFVIFVITLIYILLLILIYSLTKYFALYFVKNMLKKIKLSLTKLKSFYLLNTICIVILLVIVLLLSNVVIGGIREAYLKLASRILIFVLFLFTFAFISIAHSLFALDFNLKDILRNTFRLTFTRFSKYYGVFVVNLVVFAVYTGLYYASAKLLDLPLTLDIERYNFLFLGVGVVLLYLLQAYNRIYFYLIVKRVKQK